MKTPEPLSSTSLFDKLVAETTAETNHFVEHSLAIAHQIELILEQKGMLQKDLALAMGKTEAEISKWLCGFHNFTIKTISKIEAVLDSSIITTPCKAEQHKSEQIKTLNITETKSYPNINDTWTESQAAEPL